MFGNKRLRKFLDLFFEQNPGVTGEKFRYTDERGVPAVACIKRILDEDIGERGEFSGEHRGVPFFTPITAQILAYESFSRCECFSSLIADVADEYNSRPAFREETDGRQHAP